MEDVSIKNISSLFSNFDEELKNYRLVFIIIQCIISFITILSSSVVITLLYFKKPKSNNDDKSFRKFSIAITVSDLQCGIICGVTFLYVVQGVRINDPYCMESIAVVYYTLYVTLFLLCAMTIDRYFAIIHPVYHHNWPTKKIACIAIFGAWIGGVVMGLGVYLTSRSESPHPEVLCFITVERACDKFTLTVMFLINAPCTFIFLFAYVGISKKIMNVVRQKKTRLSEM